MTAAPTAQCLIEQCNKREISRKSCIKSVALYSHSPQWITKSKFCPFIYDVFNILPYQTVVWHYLYIHTSWHLLAYSYFDVTASQCVWIWKTEKNISFAYTICGDVCIDYNLLLFATYWLGFNSKAFIQMLGCTTYKRLSMFLILMNSVA